MFYVVGAIIYIVLNLIYSQRGNILTNGTFSITTANIIDVAVLAVVAVISFMIADFIFKKRNNG